MDVQIPTGERKLSTEQERRIQESAVHGRESQSRFCTVQVDELLKNTDITDEMFTEDVM